MIERYTRAEMGAIWTDQFRYQTWLMVELAACDALESLGKIPRGVTSRIRKKARFDVKKIKKIENTVKHDVIAFLTNVAESVGEESRFIHMGMTSSDVLDTSLAYQMKEAGTIVLNDLKNLKAVLKRQARKYKMTAMMGRSHGVHAEPVTLGLKFALWHEETVRNLDRFTHAHKRISVGMISGAVGTFAHIDPRVEKKVSRALGLEPVRISTQIIQRDRHAEFLSVLGIIASSLDKIATELRNLQRTEILEVEEAFSKGQKGSSAMPHKRNPVSSENISGLARVVRAHSLAAMENVALWHERDITHSSVERIIIPDSCILIDYMLNRMTDVLSNLVVYKDNMLDNINKTRGIIFSQEVLLLLIKKHVTRERAYEIVQRNAMRSWKEKKSFKEFLKADKEIRALLSAKEIDVCFDVKLKLTNVERIFKSLNL